MKLIHRGIDGNEVSDTRVFILAGGLGTRMRGAGLAPIPKPMEEIGGMPILWHIMKGFSTWGFRKFTVLAGFGSQTVRDYFSSGPRPPSLVRYRRDPVSGRWDTSVSESSYPEDERDWVIDVVDSGQNVGSARRVFDGISRATSEGETGPFLVTYGDGLSDVNPRKLLATHEEQQFDATVSLYRPQSRFGEVVLEGARVAEFVEKGQSSSLVNIGYCVLSPSSFGQLSKAENFESDFLSPLARKGRLGGHIHDGFWMPIDTRKELELAREMWDAGSARWGQEHGSIATV